MMAREYYDQFGTKIICDAVGVIPVNRSARDLSATRAALAALEAGYVLGVFPEGRIAPNREILPFQPGIALLAAKSEAPIHPVYLEGTQRGKSMWEAYLGPNRASLTFGQPLHLARKEITELGYEAASAKIREEVELLRTAELQFRKNQSTILSPTAYSC